MNFLLLKKGLRWIISRIFFVYAILFFVSLTFVDYKKISGRITALEMNHILPSNLSELFAIEKGRALSQEALEGYIFYYQTVAQNLPEEATPYATLGFLFYHQGNSKKALEMSEIGFKKNPTFPTFSFNLGYLYHKNKEYAKSNTVLLKTIDVNLSAVGAYLKYSFPYQQILASSLKDSKEIIPILLNHVAQAHILIAENLLLLKDYRNLSAFAQNAIKNNILYKDIFYYYAGLSAYFLKDFNSSISSFEILSEKILDPQALYYHGLAYQELGEKEKGQALLEKSFFLKNAGIKPIEEFLQGIHPHVL
ncbi:MAG TPA: hypothetical protein PLH56_07260 [Candidatus Omnitrophota bacterium]|nr:hypothetical protein [Candidatus Omnitrophota bacterium]